MGLRRVIVESPYAGDVEANIEYARRCVRDCLKRGEAPIASHLLLTQPGILDDAVPEERALGIAAGHAWFEGAEACVVYQDRGYSQGMHQGIAAAITAGVPVEYRWLDAAGVTETGKNDAGLKTVDPFWFLEPMSDEELAKIKAQIEKRWLSKPHFSLEDFTHDDEFASPGCSMRAHEILRMIKRVEPLLNSQEAWKLE